MFTKSIWSAVINEKRETEMEADNAMDKYAVCVKRIKTNFGHLPLGENVRFAKIIFHFLRGVYAVCNVHVTRMALVMAMDANSMQTGTHRKIWYNRNFETPI